MAKKNESSTTDTSVKTVSITVKTHNDSNGGHPHGIIDTVGKKHVSVGFTTKNKKGKNHGNIPLDINPLPNKKKKSYMRRQGTVDDIKNYTNPRTGEMTERDYEKAKGIVQKAKERYLTRKSEKKQKKK